MFLSKQCNPWSSWLSVHVLFMIVISVEIYCNLNILKISFNLMSNIYTTLPAGVVLFSHHSYRNKVYCEFGQVPLRWEKVGISTLKQRLDVETNVRISTLKHTSEFQRCNNSSSFTFRQSPSSTLKQHRTFGIQTTWGFLLLFNYN